MITLAIYITPPASDPFYRFASSLLGYDIWTRKIADPRPFAQSVGGAANFGFHCTVGDALCFRDEDLDEIKSQLSRICLGAKPFILTNFRLDHAFWAGLPVLVSTFTEESGELSTLANLVALNINPLYQQSPYYPKLLPLLPNYRNDYYLKYGTPQVLEHYTPHFTLASNISDETTRRALVSYSEEHFFSIHRDYEQAVDRLHLVRQKPDTFYEMVSTYLLGTGEAV